MSAYFDNLFLAQFGNIRFPIESLSIDGQQRHALHEFPHTPGSQLEKLGRKAYTFNVTPIFDETVKVYDRINGMPLYPDALTYLQIAYEEERTEQFIIPTMGTVNAFITTFRRSIVNGLRSGEKVEMSLVEDMVDEFSLTLPLSKVNASLTEKLATVLAFAYPGEAALPAADLAAIKAKESATAKDERGLFAKLEGAVNDLFALQDQGELYLMRVESKVAKVTSYLSEIDRRVDRLQNPQNWPLVEAIKDLWASSVQVARTVAKADRSPGVFTTPQIMTIQEASIAVFGTTERSFELLQMNAIEDASAIPKGFDVRYVRPTGARSLAR
jgi:hypothetical protein